MKLTSNLKGQFAISRAELRALELGFIPSRPIFDNRYDLIIDDSKTIKRIQIKYADGIVSSTDGSVRVKLEYTDRTHHTHTYKKGETDGLIVYIPKIDRLCLFPPKIYEGKKSLCIRIKPTKNNQKKKIVDVKDYFW